MHTLQIMKRRREEKQKAETVNVPVRISAELEERINSAAKDLALAKQDVMRLSIARGIEVLRAQLSAPVISAPVSAD